ncbi:MAG TPA: signal peptidase I, partial [Phenylobacterium sp.]|nr:signal peptidase I [Phenylobacterium sp.]
MSETMQASAPPEKPGAMSEILEIIKTIVYALLIALFLRVLFFQPYTIPSASMEPNLYEGDYIIVSKWNFGWSKHSIPFSPPLFSGRIFERPAQRGDIVVFKLPHDNSTDYIKRVIGIPGDRIQMKQGLLYLNGKQVPRVNLGTVREDSGYGFMHDVTRYRETLPGGRTFITNDFGPTGDLDNTEEFLVPEHHYFMMGDNRDNSSDSRVSPEAGGVGYVPAENLEGKAQLIL